jgi:hypothetical protein
MKKVLEDSGRFSVAVSSNLNFCARRIGPSGHPPK